MATITTPTLDFSRAITREVDAAPQSCDQPRERTPLPAAVIEANYRRANAGMKNTLRTTWVDPEARADVGLQGGSRRS